MTGLRWGSRTDVGQVRAVNQDNVYAQAPLFAVADGVGGAQGGEVASSVALETLVAALGAPEDNPRTTLEALVAGVRKANRVVFERSLSSLELRGMGTTLVALALVTSNGDERLCVVNVGDSRGYVVQDGRLVQITRDHSYVEDLVELGEISRDEARHHPKKNLVTRALGVEPDIEVDAWEVVPFPGDRYLLCSDGLTNEVDDDEVVRILTETSDAQAAADALTRLANERGGHDNISVVVVDVTADDLMTAATGGTQTLAAVTADPAEASAFAPDPHATTMVPTVKAETAEAEAPAAAARPTGKQPKTKKPRRRRRLPSGRAVGFVVLLLAIAGTAIGAIGYYGRSGYFVGFEGDNVAIYKGRPGGLLWLDPTVEATYPVTRDMLPDNRVAQIADGNEFENRASAEAYVENVSDQATTTTEATTTTVSGTTTTTAPIATTLPPEGQVVTTTIAVATTPPVSSTP